MNNSTIVTEACDVFNSMDKLCFIHEDGYSLVVCEPTNSKYCVLHLVEGNSFTLFNGLTNTELKFISSENHVCKVGKITNHIIDHLDDTYPLSMFLHLNNYQIYK